MTTIMLLVRLLHNTERTSRLLRQGLAEALRMGKWGFQLVAKWEKGEAPIPGLVQVAVECLLDRAAINAAARQTP